MQASCKWMKSSLFLADFLQHDMLPSAKGTQTNSHSQDMVLNRNPATEGSWLPYKHSANAQQTGQQHLPPGTRSTERPNAKLQSDPAKSRPVCKPLAAPRQEPCKWKTSGQKVLVIVLHKHIKHQPCSVTGGKMCKQRWTFKCWDLGCSSSISNALRPGLGSSFTALLPPLSIGNMGIMVFLCFAGAARR